MLTIVMYHYVRDLPRSRYPKIKGLLTEKFEGQLDYITKHYTVCSLRQVMEASQGGVALPENACHLTFDDGFIDHYDTVFPRLLERGLTGSFYPVVRAVEEHHVLDVHKIHFILAAAPDLAKIGEVLLELLKEYRDSYALPSEQELYQKYAVPTRYDGPEIAFIKKMLQRGLPPEVRGKILDQLFIRFVSVDEQAFAQELYMNFPQLRSMADGGMEIGGHGYSHSWLDTMSAEEQLQEIRRSRDFLSTLYGKKVSEWAICYPYGGYNQTTLELLRQEACGVGLTTRVGLVPDLSQLLELPRLDTNDLPCLATADAGEWTSKV